MVGQEARTQTARRSLWAVAEEVEGVRILEQVGLVVMAERPEELAVAVVQERRWGGTADQVVGANAVSIRSFRK